MKSLFGELISMFVVILFLYTAISKFIDYSIFKQQIEMSPVLSPLGNAIAFMVPAIELLVVLLLISYRLRIIGLISSFVLFTLFNIYIILTMTVSKELPCSCGGIVSQLSWGQHIVLNFAFMTAVYIGVRLELLARRREYSQLLSYFHEE